MDRLTSHPAYPYAVPFAAYVVLLAANGLHPRAVYLTYPLMVITVGFFLIRLRGQWPKIHCPHPLASVWLGGMGVLIWVGLYPWLGKTHPDTASGFNPFLFDTIALQWSLVAVRLLGATLIVPVMEEVFWRGLVQRYLVREDFQNVALGTYTHLSFFGTTALFVLAHADQWGVALLWGLLAGWWFVRTRSLGNVIVLHATTNFLLGLYVLATGRWYFW